MAARRVVVDGSNIATEGRTIPSLRQLNEAVLAFLNEYPDTEVTVVVDATFGHRIDASDVAEFEAAEANNELVSPPAGAIGRGDAFLLRIAGKIGATVLSNDSFQEFHGEHDWLFDDDRLIGGKPVPGIGWIFTPRTPVRGMKSRKAVKDAKKPAAVSSGEVLGPAPVPSAPPPRQKGKQKVAAAIAVATEEAVDGGRKRRRKKRGSRPAEPVNDAAAFLTFLEQHPLGSELVGEVETFTSHGAFVQAGGARCYVPISALGDPPPRAARDVLGKGEKRPFVVQALDPLRRGIELALPGFAKVSGTPSAETIAAEIAKTAPVPAIAVKAARPKKKAAAPVSAGAPHLVEGHLPTLAVAAEVLIPTPSPAPTAVRKAPAKKTPTKRTAPAKKAPPAQKAAATKAAPIEEAVPAKKPGAAKKAPTKKSPAKKAATNAATKAAPAQKAPAKKAAAPAKKATKAVKAVKKPAKKSAPSSDEA
jgi:hypothetical protein